MLSRIVIIGGLALSALSACNRLSPNEQKVVGTWEVPGGYGPRCIFRRDHTATTLFANGDGRWTVNSESTWQLDGNNLIQDFKFTHPGETPHVIRGRSIVIQFQQNKLVMEKPADTLFRVK